MAWREIGHEEAGHFQVNELKICELCGALNLEVNEECFVCRWHGEFDRRPEVVKMAAEVMVRRCGQLRMNHLTGPFTHRHASSKSMVQRSIRALRRFWQWLFG